VIWWGVSGFGELRIDKNGAAGVFESFLLQDLNS
jgi:hypothetical protein